jgi:HTH-type transcriptional regulator/antitoxin HigA
MTTNAKQTARRARRIVSKPKAGRVKKESKPGDGLPDYLELVRRFPLRPIRSDKELDRASEMIDALLVRPSPLAPLERDYLEVLSDLVERYEDSHHPMPEASGADVLRHLMEARGVTQSQVAAATGIVNSTISAVLSGKRRLSVPHIEKLSAYFHVGPGAFLPAQGLS